MPQKSNLKKICDYQLSFGSVRLLESTRPSGDSYQRNMHMCEHSFSRLAPIGSGRTKRIYLCFLELWLLLEVSGTIPQFFSSSKELSGFDYQKSQKQCLPGKKEEAVGPCSALH
ncbi:hypothetical protein VNO77_02867 [Canavalia gladiata]|uniref:Uncharacterized protein n=1 Tax=Canavalia gladiata TaxID=3824 RepID=A0AAN9MVT6_CANGL